ncbi:hypothetical protein HPB49_000959 [Dermacentor silvarum]|uniref:Uncharacterized protein n=1 Tax=Dermacentor silvarum TaxID=543639 RepID=A0ACB8CUA7_DERSI|nr:hypothetical protein HPB49_000959 [Dermacentor silvarum]
MACNAHLKVSTRKVCSKRTRLEQEHRVIGNRNFGGAAGCFFCGQYGWAMLHNAAGASSCSERIDSDVPGPSSRVDTVFHTEEDMASDDDNDRGTEFIIVDMIMVQKFFASTTCTKCGTVSLQFSKCNKSQYGLAVKLELMCSGCDFTKRHFSLPRSIGKGVTALVDFCATLNLSHRGLHHKTFMGHMDTMVAACQAAATATEMASVEVVKTLYKDFLSLVGNVDIIFDGTWKTRGHKSNIAVGCIIELYTGLVLDHIVLS